MEVLEQIEKFRDIFEANYKKEIHEIATTSKKSLAVDFMILAEFEPDLTELLLSQPEDAIKAAEQALSEMDIGDKDIRVRFFNLPPTQRITIRDIRSEHINKFLTFDGIIRQSSDVRPQVVSARFECPSCGNTISILQLDTKFKEPSRCSCGRRGSFRLLKKELVDAQRLVIEESPESLEGGEQPKRLSVFLKEDLVEPKMEKRTTPGSKVRVVGIIKEQHVMLPGNVQSVRLDLYADVNFIEQIEKTFEEFEVSLEDEKEIHELAKDPLIYECLLRSIAPSIYGHEGIKEALVLQLMGGVKKERPDGNITRGDMHILLVGDPGAAKCVHGDTRVNLSNGEIRDIKTLVEENLNGNNTCDDGYFKEVDFKLPSLDLNCKNKNNLCSCIWKRTSPEYLYKIKTKTSNEIIVTPTHPMFITNNGFVFSKYSKNLTVGEFIASPRRLELNTEIQKIDFTIERTKAHNGVHIRIPKYCDSNLGRFLGYIISESYVRHTDTSGETAFTNSNELLLQDFKSLAKSLFNVESNSRLRRNKTYVIRITSIELLRFLEKIDESLLKNAKYKQIPKIIQRSPNFVLKEFIKSLFDGEASVSKNKRAIVVVSASNSLIYDLRTLLLRFGIISQTSKTTGYARNTQLKIRRDYWKLTISGKEIRRYAKEIGFTSIEKQKRLFNLINSEKVYNTNIDVVPGISKLLKKLRELLRLTQFDMGISRTTYQHLERGDRNPSRKVLKLIVRKIKERLDYLSLFLDKNITIDFKKIREELNLSQESLATISNCSQTLISQYELKKVNAVKQGELQKSLLNIIKNLVYDKHLISLVKRLKNLAYSDIFWDQIKSIEKVKSDQEYVYDLTVNNVHNFVANNLFVHNSSLLMFLSKVAPKARYVSGKGTSAAGITASVVKDEFLKGFALEAGALVLANGGFLMLDEMDKMAAEDTSALHEAMAQQRISISKANIQATLKCETTILAAANPKFGRFDPYQVIASQINLPPALINRFDLIFPVRDLPNKELDSKIASHVLRLQKNPEAAKSEIPISLIKKYISYARQKIKPVLSEEAIGEIHSFYVALRNSVSGGDVAVRPIPISARQLEALVRLAEANAKIRLSSEVTLDDARKAIRLLKKCLMEVGMDKETGQIDIDIISTGISTRQRSKIWIIREIIEELGKRFEEGVPFNEIVQAAKEKNINEKDVEDVILKLEREGDLFHPKSNSYAITKRPS